MLMDDSQCFMSLTLLWQQKSSTPFKIYTKDLGTLVSMKQLDLVEHCICIHCALKNMI
jgi:hypothetical protein